MTFFADRRDEAPPEAGRGVLHVPAEQGPMRWFGADVYNIKLRAAQTNGAIGFVEASVPPGGGSVAHTHDRQTETFYVVSGELDFLDGDKTVVGRAGDVFFVPPNTRHRFTNTGALPAKLLFFYTPAGGAEEVFVEHGDEVRRGEYQVPWGPERFTEEVREAFRKSGMTVLPQGASDD